MYAQSAGIIVELDIGENTIDKINKLPSTRKALAPEGIAIRVPRLIGTEQTVTGGKLKEDDLPKFAQLCIGAPVLIGHQKETRPVGRVFDAWVENKYVYTPFYVPTERSDAKDLLIDIDTGVIAEVSASFAFDKPLCANCGQDMRSLSCGHKPGENDIFFWYNGLQRVLEVSLVYRGGHPNTGFIDMMNDPEWKPKLQAQLSVSGLVSFLNRMLDMKAGQEYHNRNQFINNMAARAQMAPSDVEKLLTSTAKAVCPSLDQLKGFASALGCPSDALILEAIKDGCKYKVREVMVNNEKRYREYE